MSLTPQQTMLNMARQLLTSTDDQAADRGAIRDMIDMVRPMVERRTGHVFDEAEIEDAIRQLEMAYVVQQGPAIAIVDREVPPDWYVGDLRRPGPFMARYLQKLAEDDWPVRSVEELRDSTARVVELLDNPTREGPWNWRGLVVGDVQSGKTAHYAGVINRAVDAGYRVVIVLAGMHNLLRLQTQQRLELDFLGFDTSPERQELGQMRAIGVGQIPPALNVGSLTLASPTGDFSVSFARQANFAPLDTPCLFVVKKNATILRNLNAWIGKLPKEFRAAPLLLIDDEADQASIDTKDQPTLSDGSFDEDYDPTRINGEIRKLLKSFARSSYVAYTATPFANILIHDERGAANYGSDLFPSTFIFSLTPPDDYFGPAAVFGTTSDGPGGGLPVIRHVPRDEEAWVPENHDKTLRPRFDFQDELPPSLKEAVRAFLIGCAVRVARGRPTAHNSMLIHVSRFVDVHGRIHAQVERYLDDIRARISGRDAATLADLKALWDLDFVPTRSEIAGTVFERGIIEVAWNDVLAVLADSSDRIQVVVSNGRSKAGLDYDRYRETGLSVIAIGGDKLSRGLTLEGLIVSYFLRVSKQYDSLLQMGRWFGYRRGFADICRLYTTADMEDWFRHVASASQDLRAELARMRIMLQTPKDFRLQTPKTRRLSKLDLARYLNSWSGLPYRVCLGGQKNFQHFMQKMKETPPPLPDEVWFRRLVAIGLVFRAAERIVRQMGFPAFRAQIAAYLVAALAQRTGGRLDFEAIWKRQSVSPELEQLLRAWAPEMDRLLRTTAGQRNPGEWFKKEDCWKELRDQLPPLSDPLPPEIASAAAVPLGAEGPTDASAPQLSVEDFNRITRCMEIDSSEWLRAAEIGQNRRLLHRTSVGICRTLAGYAAAGWERRPSPKQARYGLEALATMKASGVFETEDDEGFMIGTDPA